MGDVPEKKFGGLRILIDRDLCIGTGNCVKVASEVFELDEGSISSFKEGSDEIEEERLIDACKVCPVNALAVVDSDGKRIVP